MQTKSVKVNAQCWPKCRWRCGGGSVAAWQCVKCFSSWPCQYGRWYDCSDCAASPSLSHVATRTSRGRHDARLTHWRGKSMGTGLAKTANSAETSYSPTPRVDHVDQRSDDDHDDDHHRSSSSLPSFFASLVAAARLQSLYLFVPPPQALPLFLGPQTEAGPYCHEHCFFLLPILSPSGTNLY